MDALDYQKDGLDRARIVAWLFFPEDEGLRKHYFARERAKLLCESGSREVPVPREVLLTLINGPGHSELERLATEATKQGSVAGDLASLYYQQHALGYEEPSFGKALTEYKDFAIGEKYGDGEPLKYSEQTLRNYFRAFRKVAHLWGALRLAGGPLAYVSDKRTVLNDEDAQLKFLGVAKAVGEFLTTFVPKRTKPAVPLIAPGDLLVLPDDIPVMRLGRPDRSNLH